MYTCSFCKQDHDDINHDCIQAKLYRIRRTMTKILNTILIVALLVVLSLMAAGLGEVLYITRQHTTPQATYHADKELDQKPISLHIIPSPTLQSTQTTNGPLPDNPLSLDAYDYVSQYDCMPTANDQIECQFDDGLIVLSQGTVTVITMEEGND
jgi:hypothetical protein